MSFWKEASVPIIAFALGLSMAFVISRKNTNLLQHKIDVKQDQIDKRNEIIERLTAKDTIQLIDIDSVLKVIDEKPRDHIDSMSANDLRNFLLGTD